MIDQNTYNQWQNAWRTGTPLTYVPVGFENPLDSLALASLTRALCVMPNPPADIIEFDTLPYVLSPLPPALRSRVCAALPNLGAQTQRQLCLLIERAGYEMLPEDTKLFKTDLIPTFDVYKWDIWKKGLAHTTDGWKVFSKPTYATLHNILIYEFPNRQAACELMAENIPLLSSKANLEKLFAHIREQTRPEHKLIVDAINTDKVRDKRLLSIITKTKDNFDKVADASARQEVLRTFAGEKRGVFKKKITVHIHDVGLWSLLMYTLQPGELKQVLNISWSELFHNMPAKVNNRTLGPLLRAAFLDGEDNLAQDIFSFAAKHNILLGHRMNLGQHLGQKPNLSKSLKANPESLVLPNLYLDLMDGKTVPKNEITSSTSWKKALSFLENSRTEHKGQHILRTLAFLFSPEDAQSFIDTAKPQDVLALGPVWDILHIIAALKGHIS